ncbi:hypothetical protein [Ornithinimicrobium tianjinense]|uniref:Uncharacterized protein n=1 Tax=Ornithinimicrobium tianjinense TaxID=1195761 RepID=A0A917F358_9MICO|nr:hypothetical protein [Ornithinimicrobium tianjinense]GGF44121.1 hypothetical protein GCM10011366_09760 [Ornithinimicrobium tianjinense]
MTSKYAIAPPPPAGPGMTPEDGAIEHYVSELARWRLHRDHELRALDALVRTHEDRDELNEDITLAMTLWHAIAQRHDLLLATWEQTKDGDGEREWISRLIWGLLEMPAGDAHALAIGLPDALRFSDALAASLRARVNGGDDDIPVDERLEAALLELARARTHVRDRGAPHDGIEVELDDVERALESVDPAGADAVEQLGALESRIARVERDLVVAGAAEAHERADVGHAVDQREELVARGEAVRALAERVLNTVHPAPRLGIPDVNALGDVPKDDDDLATYMANLERVARALDQAHTTYAGALAEYADLADRAHRLAGTLAGCGAPTSVDLAGMLTATKESLNNLPADVQRAAALIAAQEAYLGQLRPDA